MNVWLTFAFPYHGIQIFDFTQGRRLPSDYSLLLDSLDPVPARLGQLCAVGYVLAPTEAVPELNQLAGASNAYEIAYTYDIEETTELGLSSVRVLPATEQEPGPYAILRVHLPAPRFALLGKWFAATDAQALSYLANPFQPLWQAVALAPDDVASLPYPGNSGFVGTVEVLTCKAGRVVLRIDTPAPAILRISNRYDPHWRATIDGKSTRMLKCDFMFQALPVVPGAHEVVLQYVRPPFSFFVLIAGAWICCGAILALIFKPLAVKTMA